jgi:hypothetical protein
MFHDEGKLNIYLHGDTFVLVRHFNVMDPDVGPPHINSVQSTFITSSNDHVIYFTLEIPPSAKHLK